MLLNKELCKKCVNMNYGIKENGWNKWDEIRWKAGEILCPIPYIGKEEVQYRKIDDEPPSKCPFILEQII